MLPAFGMLDKNDVYEILINRLKRKYRIDLEKHIKKIIKKHPFTGDGIDFVAHDTEALIGAIKKVGFRYDDPNNFCERIASLATTGKGFREPDASPAFHFQIADQVAQPASSPSKERYAPNHCNVHLDAYGFVSVGSDGIKYYNPDLFQHIIGDLAWPIVQQKLLSQLPFSFIIHHFTDRLYPIILPTSKTLYQPKFEGKFNLFQTGNLSGSLNWRWVNTFQLTQPKLNVSYHKSNYIVSADLHLNSILSRPVLGGMINLQILNW